MANKGNISDLGWGDDITRFMNELSFINRPSADMEIGDDLEQIEPHLIPGLLKALLKNPDEFLQCVFDKAWKLQGKGGKNIKVEDTRSYRMMNFVAPLVLSSPEAEEEMMPLLNNMNAEAMKSMDGKIVRFRGMVQQSLDPVFVPSFTTITNKATGEKQKKCLLFMQKINLANNEEKVDDKYVEYLQNMEMYHVVSVPGQNEWDLGPYADRDRDSIFDTVGTNNSTGQASVFKQAVTSSCNAIFANVLRDALFEIGMNEALDIYGILRIVEDSDIGNNEEDQVQNNVKTCTPHLAVLGCARSKCKQLASSSHCLQTDQMTNLEDLKKQFRYDLMSLLRMAFLGDELCAQFVLVNLLSTVESRSYEVPVGPFPICITGIPVEISRFVKIVIQNLVPRCVYLEKFLDNVNKEDYIPRMDYEANKLVQGALQLSDDTHLILEETRISADENLSLKQNPKAMDNLYALEHLIEHQSMDYDFKYQKFEFKHNIPVLVLAACISSKCTNMLQVPFKPVHSEDSFETQVKPAILKMLEDKVIMGRIRRLIQEIRKSSSPLVTGTSGMKINSNVEARIGRDFVAQRQQRGGMTPEELSSCLTRSRYVIAFEGLAELTEDLWTRVLATENERKERVNW